MAPELFPFLQAVFFFMEFVIYKRICDVLVNDCLSNGEKWDSKDNLLSWNYAIVLWKRQ